MYLSSRHVCAEKYLRPFVASWCKYFMQREAGGKHLGIVRYAENEMKKRICTALVSGLLLTMLLGACATVNEPLKSWDPNHGYRPSTKPPFGPTDHTVFGLHFSGGGIRAAAFAHGVLEELAETTVVIGGHPQRLLDEVDYVNGVSGGSFTAAYFTLFGDRIFEDYEERFLKRNVQADLILRLFWPWNWVRMLSPFYDRIDLAVDYYHDHIFDGATFGDLNKRDGPVLNINTTDLSTGNPFSFTQEQFDFICSDLSSFPVARAVGASSAVPILFPPVLLHNYAGTCGFEKPSWLQRALKKSRRKSVRRWRSARILSSYLDNASRPYIHLIDGGISDNLALRNPIDQASDVTIWEQKPGKEHKDLQRIVVIVANAQTESELTWSLVDQFPSVSSLLGTMTNAQIDVLSAETIELLHNFAALWEARTSSVGTPTRVYVIEVTFQSLQDEKKRQYLNNLSTNLNLPDDDVDLLQQTARELLRTHPEYQRLLRDLSQRPHKNSFKNKL